MAVRKNRTVYQLKVTLQETRPPVWRRAQVWEDMTLAQLHRVLQVIMGWEDCHLHDFKIGRLVYSVPDPEDPIYERHVLDEKRSKLRDVVAGVGAQFIYVYDFGDNWQHEVLLEAILLPDSDRQYPFCNGGERSAPPEDVGGIGGYERYLEVMANPEHSEYEDLLRWRGELDPEAFSFEAVNKQLRKVFRLVGKRSQKHIPSTPAANNPPGSQGPMDLVLDRDQRPKNKKTKQPIGEIHLELNARELELILRHTFAPVSLTARLRILPKSGVSLSYGFTLDELDELAGYVAAEANHAKDRKLENELHQLSSRITRVLAFCT